MRQSFLMNERIYLRAVEPEDMDIMYEMDVFGKGAYGEYNAPR